MIKTIASFQAIVILLLYPLGSAFPSEEIKSFYDIDFYPEESNLRQVTNKYGSLYIKKSQLHKIQTFESKIKPWSSWWYPSHKGELIKTKSREKSPLQKLDIILKKKLGLLPQITSFELDNLYDPRASNWTGLCDAWAIASIYFKEPSVSKIIFNTKLSISDQKAVLLKSLESTNSYEILGQRNNGQWDAVYADIYPDELFKFLQYHLIERKKAVIVDTDASFEVWSKPVYKIQFKFVPFILDDLHYLRGSVWVHMASHDVELNYIGLKRVVKKYTFNLKVTDFTQDNILVEYGQWTERSRWDHPDYVMLFDKEINKSSLNTNFNKYIPNIYKLYDFQTNGGNL